MSEAQPSVLHISKADRLGGAARSAYKIHSGLRRQGWCSRMLVRSKISDEPEVDHIHRENGWLRMLDAAGRELVDRGGLQYLYYPSSFSLRTHPWFQEADIVQLYNIHGGYFTYRALPALSRLRPLVWRLSDMWPLTGHCSYSYECDRWQTGCGSCPRLEDYPALPWDTTRLLWRMKQRVYERSRLTLVTTNTWMDRLVAESPLLKHFPRHMIPNGVDTDVFRPIPKNTAREALGLSTKAKVVLFAAHVARAGTRKGGEFVPIVIERLAAQCDADLVLLIMGEGAEDWPDNSRYYVRRIGFTQSDRLMAVVYSAADVLLYPALAENFPNIILESMACGTPVVAFDTGGVPDVVRHMQTGYLAKYADVDDLSTGLQMLVEDAQLRNNMSVCGHDIVQAEYTDLLQTTRFADLYVSLLDRRERQSKFIS